MLPGSIRSRLLGLVFATVVPFTALIGAGLWNQWREDQAAVELRAIDEARLLAAQVDDHIGSLENLLIGVSQAVSTEPAAAQANDAVLQRVRSQLPSYVNNVLLMSPQGIRIGTSADKPQGRDRFRDRPSFRRALAGERLTISEPFRGRNSGLWTVAISRPVEDQEGHIIGVLAVGTQLDHFQDALKVHALPPGSVVRIINESGIVIAQSEDGASWIGRDLSGAPGVTRHIAAKEASEVIRWPDNVERMTGSATAHRAPWLVSVGLPTGVAFAGVARRLGWGALFIGLTLATAFAIAWMLSGRMARPLRQLGKDASALAAGDLSHRTTVHSQDEVGALAENFNRMAESLEQRRDELREAKDSLAAVIDASPVAIVCSDRDRKIVLWSRGAEQIFGYTAGEVLGQGTKLVPDDGKTESQALFDRAFRGETLRHVQVKRQRKDGVLLDVRVAAAPMYQADGVVGNVAWVYEDITYRTKAEEQLRRLAHYDPLTELPNRLSLQKELGRRLADRQRSPTSVVLFDLDGFKDVNDTLGHSTGDELLIEVGQRLIKLVEDSPHAGKVCRLGGDEFVVIIPDCGDPRPIAEFVDAMMKRLAEPFVINDHTLHIAASAGIAIAPNDGANADELIANADLALYDAKSAGRRTHRFFFPVLRAQAQARRALDAELRRAFAQGEFELHFQPQIRLADEAVVGAEALLRWRHPDRGILAPGAFIDTLADSAIAPEVGRWIIRAACEHMAAWRAKELPLARIAVNLFASQVHGETLLNDVSEALQSCALPPEALELEITENVALHDGPASSLQQLYEKGVRLAFDDFGTGYASLNSLTRFPISRIKIDRSFVTMITENTEDTAIVRSLIAMAHNLGLEVIAEGVETQAQAAFLLNERCQEAQGFLYAKPLPAAEFERYLRARLPVSAVAGQSGRDPAHGQRRRAAGGGTQGSFSSI